QRIRRRAMLGLRPGAHHLGGIGGLKESLGMAAEDVSPVADGAGQRTGEQRRERRGPRVPIAMALVGGVALLILVAVGSVLTISLLGATKNTRELLVDKADIGLALLESRVRGQLDPVRALGVNIAEMIANGRLDPADSRAFESTLRGALAAIPQATAIIFVDSGYQMVHVSRTGGPLAEVVRSGSAVAGLGGMLDTHEGMEQMMESAHGMAEDSAWFPPIWVQSLEQPVLALEIPSRRDGELLGVVFVVVALGDLADFLAALEEEDQSSAFILYDRNFVLSHPDLFGMMLAKDDEDEVPLPEVSMFEDPALALVFNEKSRAGYDPGDPALEVFQGTPSVDGADESYVVITREVGDIGARAWHIGLKFREAEVTAQLARLRNIAIAGFVILAIAVVAGLLFGRSLTRQVGQLATAAESLRTLDIGSVGHVPDSRFRELSNAAHAFNSMTAALRWFETYVPKSLVLRLMRRGDEEVTASQERELTVMFTDIRGFSTLAENMPASEIAALLNRHFQMLSACIEAEGGTVDKFIGDSVMAFWGAPEHVEDHAARALRAARAIMAAVAGDNARRRAAGEVEVGVRIGLHTGPVVVGNIGSESRVNYTVVGDTVNAASRLEALAKEIGPEDECVVLLSDATSRGAGQGFELEPLGARTLKGKAEPVEVYRLGAA
ncbi:MAG: adenylate/guanylate cyclase domain-containing protein, partial [Alphaproteobacteria bacterium]